MIFATGLYLAHISTNASRLLYYYFFCVNFVLTYLCLEFLHRAEQDYIASHKEIRWSLPIPIMYWKPSANL